METFFVGVCRLIHNITHCSGSTAQSALFQIHLRRVGVDNADVLHPFWPLQQHLLHVAADRGHHWGVWELGVDEPEELGDVSHQFLTDAFARAVDGQLQGRGRVEHSRCEHGDADGLAESGVEET